MLEDENIGEEELVSTEQAATENTAEASAEEAQQAEQTGQTTDEAAQPAAQDAGQAEQTPQERSAFAERRRNGQIEEMRVQLQQTREAKEKAERAAEQARQAMSHFFAGDDINSLVNSAMAQATGKTPQEIAAERSRQDQMSSVLSQKEQELLFYRQKELERAMSADLASIKKLNPNVKSLEELGEPYFKLISAGVDAATAYNAVMAAQRPKPKPADKGGKDHLITTGGSAGPSISIPPDVVTDYERFGFSRKDAEEDYRKNMRKGK